MIALILFLAGIFLFTQRHPWFGGLCWLAIPVVLFFG